MSNKIRTVFSFCMVSFVLILCGCSTETNEDTSSAKVNASTITITAAFKQEDGIALANDTIRFSDNENSMDYQLDEKGKLNISGLPREGELSVTVLDKQTQPQGTITLSFTQGSVVDVATSENSIGHITLKEDTEELALDFVLCDDNSIQCSLQLAQPRVV